MNTTIPETERQTDRDRDTDRQRQTESVYALRIVSTDKILRSINTLIINYQ